MKKVVITGSKGKIGLVLFEELSKKYELVGLDLPEVDINERENLLPYFSNADVVIHAAHSTDKNFRESWKSGNIDPNNVKMEMNVLDAAVRSGVKRLIVASSVHADKFDTYEGAELLSAPGSYSPTSPYGAHKIILEEIGKYYAEKYRLEFIAMRFGGVTSDNTVKTFGKEPEVWLSHRDLAKAVVSAIDAQSVPNNHSIFYVVSENAGKLHSTSNPFGWIPKDNSADHIKK